MKGKFFSKFRTFLFCTHAIFTIFAISSCKSTQSVQLFNSDKKNFSPQNKELTSAKSDFFKQKIILDLCNFDEDEIYFFPKKQSGARYSQISQDWCKSDESSVKFSFSGKNYDKSQFFTEDFCGENWNKIFMIEADFFNGGKNPVSAEFILETQNGDLFFTEEKKLDCGENLNFEFYFKDFEAEKNSQKNQNSIEVKNLYITLKSPQKYASLYMDNLRLASLP